MRLFVTVVSLSFRVEKELIRCLTSEKIDESASIIISLEDSDAFCCVMKQLQFRISPIDNIGLRRDLIP